MSVKIFVLVSIAFNRQGRGGINQGSWLIRMDHWMVITFVSNVGDFHINTVEIKWGEQNEEKSEALA